MKNEIWKPVIGFEGLYEVSSCGNLRSVDRTQVSASGVTRFLKGKLISKSSLSYGYPVAILVKNGERKTVRIHRLVAEAFIPNPENKPFIDHIDTDRTNACVDNLRWVTRKENANNAISIENYKRSASKKHGSGWKTIETRNTNGSCHAEVPVCQYTLDGVFVCKYRSISEARNKTNIQSNTIIGAIKGKFKQAGGFLWAKDGESPRQYIPNTPTRQRAVFQYSMSGEFLQEWLSVSEAERELSISNVSRCARERKYPAGGFWWSYTKRENFFCG